MPRITPVDPAEAAGQPKVLLDAVQSALGATPNMATTMAGSSVLAGWLELSGALSRGAVKAADRERIALAVAEANSCSYCLSAHTYLGENVAKLDASEIALARGFASADEKSDALLKFASAVVKQRGAVSEDQWAAAQQAGLTDAELADTVGVVALNVLTNYFNKAFEVEVDFPVVEPRLQAAA